eukprot:TRINITY_DN3245_c0_g2_i2.p1 TRINITY_DN3245_c0_g2~~TRINITY_DN3245_c0_g2_i2.p1  ORF type:complete len:311 (+),score=-37.32 TRINITY_DN3245_c0_g2_i2:60-935(+)
MFDQNFFLVLKQIPFDSIFKTTLPHIILTANPPYSPTAHSHIFFYKIKSILVKNKTNSSIFIYLINISTSYNELLALSKMKHPIIYLTTIKCQIKTQKISPSYPQLLDTYFQIVTAIYYNQDKTIQQLLVIVTIISQRNKISNTNTTFFYCSQIAASFQKDRTQSSCKNQSTSICYININKNIDNYFSRVVKQVANQTIKPIQQHIFKGSNKQYSNLINTELFQYKSCHSIFSLVQNFSLIFLPFTNTNRYTILYQQNSVPTPQQFFVATTKQYIQSTLTNSNYSISPINY